MEASFFAKNREGFIEQMENASVAVFFSGWETRRIGDQFYYPHEVTRNFYYLTGLRSKDFTLIIHKERTGKANVSLHLPPINARYEKYSAIMMRDYEAREITGIENVSYDCPDTKIDAILSTNGASKDGVITVYADIQPTAHYEHTYAMALTKRLRKRFPQLCVKNAAAIVHRMRFSKTEPEIEAIRRAIADTDLGLKNLVKNLRPGVSEFESHHDFCAPILRKGEGIAFEPIVAIGENALILHATPTHTIGKENDLVLVDAGAMSELYCSDISRTYPVSGKFTEKQKEMYKAVLGAQEACFAMCRAGNTMKMVNEAAKDFYKVELKRIGLIKEDSELENYYYHGVSHSIGLDTHDCYPEEGADTVLTVGAVITIEPGLYIKELGFGIRIEDDVLITKDGCEILSKAIIKDIDEIEKFMAENR